jgi:dienelactone hydrolase
MKKKFWLALLVWVGFCLSARASDLIRERAYAAEIIKTLSIGKDVWLKADGTEFLGIYTETDKLKNAGTAIILHDIGGHPNRKKITYALRALLPDHNWTTLSLQMPIQETGTAAEAYDQLFPEALSRIQSGLDFLTAEEKESIVLVGYGLGGSMALYFQNQNVTPSISAIVTISLPISENSQQSLRTLEYLKDIDIPLFDIFAGQDLSELNKAARKRHFASKNNPAYLQLKINAAEHDFAHYEDLLIKRVYSWLSRIVK